MNESRFRMIVGICFISMAVMGITMFVLALAIYFHIFGCTGACAMPEWVSLP